MPTRREAARKNTNQSMPRCSEADRKAKYQEEECKEAAHNNTWRRPREATVGDKGSCLNDPVHPLQFLPSLGFVFSTLSTTWCGAPDLSSVLDLSLTLVAPFRGTHVLFKRAKNNLVSSDTIACLLVSQLSFQRRSRVHKAR